MNERRLRKLLGRIVLAAVPLPALACGGVATRDDSESQGGSAGTGGTTAGLGGGAGTVSVSVGGGVAVGGSVSVGGSVGVGGFAGTISYAGSAGYGANGGGAGTGQGGVGGGSCQGTPSNCLEYTSVVIDESCVGAAQVLSSEQCAYICNRLDGCVCGSFPITCSIASRDAGTITVQCPANCFVGRRPAAFEVTTELGDDLGAHFARAAELEALAVIAFENLRDELRELGAPSRLRRALSSAARDEVRHARITSRLARRFGKRATMPRALPRERRSLEAIAIENAVEGCVREAYGALSAVWQAQVAGDPSVRSALRKIARDEIRHAALSLKVQSWIEPRLGAESRGRVAAAKRAAIAELRSELAVAPPEATVRLAGHPDRAQAQRLLDELEVRLWS